MLSTSNIYKATADNPGGLPGRKRLGILSIGAIIVLALLLRLPELNRTGLWLDEGISLKKAGSSLHYMLSVDPNPPTYYLLLKIWTPIAGSSEAGMRFPSFLAGVLSVLLVCLLGRRLFGLAGAVFAGGLMALSPLGIHFSSEARMYQLEILLSLISMWYFLNLLEGKGRGSSFAYLLSTSALILLHNFAFVIPLVQNLYVWPLFIHSRGLGRLAPGRWLKIQIILLLLVLPGLYMMLLNAIAIQGAWWNAPLRWEELGNTFVLFGGSFPLAIAIFSLAVFGLLSERTQRPVFFTLWILLPILVPVLVSLFFTPVYVTRFTLPAHGPLLLLAGAGFSRLSIRVKIPLLIGIVSLIVVALNSYYRTEVRQPLRETAGWFESGKEAGDILISPPWYQGVIGEYYGVGGGRRVYGLRQIPLEEKDSFTWKAKRILGDKPGWLVDCEGGLEEVIKSFGDDGAVTLKKELPYFNYQAGRRMYVRIYRLQYPG